MATQLKKTTQEIKRLFIYFLLFILFVFIVDWLVNGSKEDPLPPEPIKTSNYPPINEIYGKLPKPDLLSINATSGTFGLVSLNNTNFPEFPPVIYIYSIEADRELLNDAQLGKDMAKKLNFPEDYSVINNIMNWESNDKNRTLTFDRFKKHYIYKSKVTNLELSVDTDQQGVINKALNSLKQLNINDNLFQVKSSNAIYAFKNFDNKLITNVSSYNVVNVFINKQILAIKDNSGKEFFVDIRKNKYFKGSSTLLIKSKIENTDKISDYILEFDYKKFDFTNNNAVYELKNIEEAFKNLQQNKGILYRLNLSGGNTLGDQEIINIVEYNVDSSLTKLILIEPDNRDNNIASTTYLYPYYLFEGKAKTVNGEDAEFAFLVQALSDNSYIQ